MYFTESIFWLKNNLFRKKAIIQYNDALEHCRLSKEELKKLNWEKRLKIITFAYYNIPFYKKYYNEMSFHPSMLNSEKDWEKVPILEKEYVRQNLELLKDPTACKNSISIATTGGSTGKPLKVYTDNRFHTEILGWRAFSWWEISPADNIGIIHRRVPIKLISQLKNRALWWPTKRAYLNASSINNENIKIFIDELVSNKTVWLQGYVGALEHVAEYMLNNNIQINTLKLIWSTAAPLSNNVRFKLEKAFGCKVMNQYGCNEIANIAQQCPTNEYLHINYDYVHIDIIDKNSKNIIDQEGDILVTNLESFVCPLIKYRLGDKGTILSTPCSCGNPLPLLKPVKGRISDSVYTPDNNTYIDGNYLNSIFDDYPLLFSQFQVYQKADFSITLKVKIYQDNDETLLALKHIKERLEQDVEHKIPITIQIVNHIDDDHGKIRYIISEIALEKMKEK